MAPKVLVVLGVLMAALLFISSEVTARELAETTAKEEQAKVAVEDQSRGRCFRSCRCCYWIFAGCCGRCCSNRSSEAADAFVEGAEDAVADQYGSCPRGSYCCGGFYNGLCRRCCHHKNEAPETETEAKPHN